MDVQLHQLRYVLALAEDGQFVRAAARLHVAQPSVSSAVRALERELGVPLFDRARTGLALTAAGQAFLPWARQALADCEAGVDAVRELRGLQRGRVTLGATPSLTTTLLPSVLPDFRRDHPGIDLVVEEAGSGVLVEHLEQGRMDFALVILPVDRSWVRTTVLAEEELVLAVHAGHPLASRAAIALADLRGVPLVMFRDGYDLRDTTVAACQQAGFQPVHAVEGLEMDGVLAMAGAGMGAAVVPASVVPPGGALRPVRFSDRELVREVGLASRQDRTLSAAASRVADRLVAYARHPHRDGGSAKTGARSSK